MQFCPVRNLLKIIILSLFASFLNYSSGFAQLNTSIREISSEFSSDWAMKRADRLKIRAVELVGNKKTKEGIIFRELSYQAGDDISADRLDSLLLLEANKVFNTNLFVTVELTYEAVSYEEIKLTINMLEKWYIYALPVVDVADRNFNEWWQNRDGNLNRLEYGFNFRKLNFRGRNETIKVDFRWGFNRKLKLGYEVPYINKKKTLGVSMFFEYLTNRNIPYATEDNKLAFWDTESTVRRQTKVNLDVISRKSFYNFHTIGAEYAYEWVADSVLIFNPDYFLHNSQRLSYFSLKYQFEHDFTDNRAFPLKGRYARIRLEKNGLGLTGDVDILQLNALYRKFTQLSERFYLSNTLSLQASTPRNQPYPLNRGLGYQQTFVRGYDLYVVDGQNFVLNRNTVRFKLLEKIWKVNKIPLEQFRTIPIMILAKGFFDTAYSQNRGIMTESNTFQNRWLYGGGFGLDIVSFYNSSVRIEYSWNAEKESGLFFYYNVSL